MSFGIGNMGLMAQLMRQYNLPGRRAGGFLIDALGVPLVLDIVVVTVVGARHLC
jgi:hypothetical protein